MSVNVPSSSWRLSTAGGIPYKMVSRVGNFSRDDGTATEIYIIKANRLMDFIEECYPAPYGSVGQIIRDNRITMPGMAPLVSKGVSWESLDDGRPVDPFGSDSVAPEDTYCPDLKITIQYGTSEENDGGEQDPDDPLTYLTIAANASCQFLSPPPRKTKWKTEYVGGGFEEVEVKEPDVQLPIIVPLVEWTAVWSQIPNSFMNSDLIGRLRDNLGKVNSKAMPIFYGAPEDTVQFLGWTLNQQFTWRVSDRPPVRLEMKFLEKNFKDEGGNQITHFHQWRPGFGWTWVLVDGDNLYPSADLNQIFVPGQGEE